MSYVFRDQTRPPSYIGDNTGFETWTSTNTRHVACRAQFTRQSNQFWLHRPENLVCSLSSSKKARFLALHIH